MRLQPLETGVLLGEFPYVRFGDGRSNLVVFPGITDALRDVTVDTAFAAWFCEGIVPGRSVYVISRRRNLPEGCSMRALAADYARVFTDHLGIADVFGISMGSAFAQFFAADYPQFVRRLVLGMAGARMDPSKRGVVRSWASLARDRRWRELYLEMIAATHGPRRRATYDTLIPEFGKLAGRYPDDPSDFIVSIDALVSRDSSDRLAAIQAPTLVIGGTRDELVPEHLLRDLAGVIPNAILQLFDGAGHGVFEERKADFDRVIREFLAG